VTLGGYLAFKGVMLAATGASTIAVNNETFNDISAGYIGRIPGLIIAIIVGAILAYISIRGNLKKKKLGIPGVSAGAGIGKGIGILALCVVIALVLNAYEGIPYLFIIMLIVVGVFTFIAEYTTFGRHLYAIGGNAQAARYTGINVKFNVLMTYIISGMLSAVAAILLVSRVGAATTSAGLQYEMDAIAASVIGGCSLAGGIGHVYGVLIGGLVMTTLDNGMSIMNVDSFWQYIVKGIVLVGAVAIDVLSNKQKAK
jgi:D-xylose transport system permease protein